MGCSGDREKGEAPLEEKWDYVVGRLTGPPRGLSVLIEILES